MNYVWDERIEYLFNTRKLMWNNDYMGFLIQNIWKIDKPVDVLDFGCGIGFLASLLMPLLPSGSSYTGIDIGKDLIEKAKDIYRDSKFNINFFQADLVEYVPSQQYDISICQTFLGHVSEPMETLGKMVKCLRPGGRVICIEPDGNIANAGVYIDGLERNEMCDLGTIQQYWINNQKKNNFDGCIGLKIPIYLKKMGLKDVAVRINDCAQFVDPDKETYESDLASFKSYGSGSKIEDINIKKRMLVKLGIDKEKAAEQCEFEKTISNYLNDTENIYAVQVPAFVIAYGTVS